MFKIFKIGDAVLVAVILAGTFLWMGGGRLSAHEGKGRIAVIRQDDKVLKTIDLDGLKESLRITVDGKYHEVILAEKGRIRFLEADCPDRLCRETGWISEKGDLAVCLPNRVMIKIQGSSDDVDTVAY